MRILVAIDSFKGTLTSREAGEAVARGLRSALDAHIDVVPVSDGGEGLIEAYRAAGRGELTSATCRGPLHDPVTATFLLDGVHAVVEMAASSGLVLVDPAQRNPLHTSTWGVGDQMRAALDHGASSILVGLGGSSTCDGGAGMAAAQGVRFLDAQGGEVRPTGGSLVHVASIDTSGLDPRVPAAEITVACDVRNPLTGPQGAARVFAPQKGASPADVELLEQGLERLADLLEPGIHDQPGTGAAGGLAAGLVAFCGARLAPGFETVAAAIGLEERIARADLVVTGEGGMDAQTLMGKLPAGVAAMASRHDVPVVAFCGRLDDPDGRLQPSPFSRIFDLVSFASSAEAAVQGGADLLEELARESASRL